MKLILIICFSVLVKFGSAQIVDVNGRSITNLDQKTSIDSFRFASKTYKVPRSCSSKNASNCAVYSTNPDQLNFYNGVTLSWSYILPIKGLSVVSLEDHLTQFSKYANFKREHVMCLLLNEKVNGYRISYTTETGMKANLIIVSKRIDDKVVRVELNSTTPIKKNTQIPSGARQILQLKG